ncbi:MAG: hypothetical protein SCABRO_01217 [Candidatus Scalindua brodae]|uniref:Uncharacterized protein n=1 Tax=Candidatus Scalindua brodae TaxID=237368 RepID=A0A0B0EQR3_9BACT|nr:MAG: hypothetical protein SCABRO_01217 [Candidatus Scalindua brodae]
MRLVSAQEDRSTLKVDFLFKPRFIQIRMTGAFFIYIRNCDKFLRRIINHIKYDAFVSKNGILLTRRAYLPFI